MKLVYFNGRGLAENSRLILAYVGVEYEDFRYNMEVIDWKTHNINKPEFDADKASGKLRQSLNKLPYLEVDGSIVCQSKSIERYLARRFNLMGSNDIEAAQIDSICEVVRDIKDMYQGVRRLPEAEREAGMAKWFSETMPIKLSDLEHILGSIYAVGSALSLADIVLFSLIHEFFDNKTGALNACQNCPKLNIIIERVASNSNIENWRNNRPNTGF